ncbi:hypothetical protein R6Q57_013659 [Mikania cordata]
MVKKFALQSRRQIYIGKNEALRYRIICLGSSSNTDVGKVAKGLGESSTSGKIDQSKKVTKRKTKPTCPFAIHISRPSIKDLWCVKTINQEHKCLHTRDVGLYTMSFIAKEIEPMSHPRQRRNRKDVTSILSTLHMREFKTMHYRVKGSCLQNKVVLTQV